ncbi:MAG: hypothetical protein ACM3NZ_07725 [Betaproteobacteria bacterium]|jgi:hypothetical protein
MKKAPPIGMLLAALSPLTCAAAGGMYASAYALFEPERRSAVEDTRPAFVLKIDGKSVGIDHSDPVPPGVHAVELSIPGPPGMGQSARDTLTIEAKACTRYYFAARRSSPTARDWKAFVATSEPIGECLKRFPNAT